MYELTGGQELYTMKAQSELPYWLVSVDLLRGKK